MATAFWEAVSSHLIFFCIGITTAMNLEIGDMVLGFWKACILVMVFRQDEWHGYLVVAVGGLATFIGIPVHAHSKVI